MDSNGVSREATTASTYEDDDYMRIEPFRSESPELGRSESPDIGLQNSRRRGLSDAHSPDPRVARQRGLSEAQQLLTGSERGSERNSFEVEVTRAFHYVPAPVVGDDNGRRESEDAVGAGYPQPLKSGWRSLGKDLSMIIVTFPFFGLAAGVIYFDGNVQTEYFENLLDNYTKVAATLFPIVFSMIVGRAIYKIASWKLERGSNVGLLEQLLGSRTFSSTIFTQSTLWTSPFIGFALIILWILSPVGSQAALRMLSTKVSSITSATAISYINMRQPIYSGNGFGSWFPGFATLFSASLIAPVEIKAGPTDSWGNVKIPYLSSLSDVLMNQDGWRLVPVGGIVPIYSSLFGIPLSKIPSDNTTFTIESTYIELTCSTRTTEKVRGENRVSSFENPGLIATNGLFDSAENVTELTNWAIGYLGEDITSLLPPGASNSSLRLPCLDCLPTTANDTKYAGIILFQDFTGAENVTSIYCNAAQIYIESQIHCSTSSSSDRCVVTAQRESLLPHTPSKITLLSFSDVSLGVSKFLPNTTLPSAWLDPVLNYLSSPLSNALIPSIPHAYLDAISSTRESRLQTLPLQNFGLRLGQLINAFLYGSAWNSTQFLTGADFSELGNVANAPDFTAKTGVDLYLDIRAGKAALTVQSETITPRKIFALSIPWLTFYLLATLIIFLAAVMSLVVSRRLLTPSYLGYVSTLVRESAYITEEEKLTDTNVRMGGLERAREMRGVRVRLGDVGDLESGHEVGTGVEVRVGRLAVGGMEGTRGVERGGRLYL